MIAVEAALSVFLLCGAALVGQNLRNLVKAPNGFDAQDVTVIQLRMPYRREQALNPTPMMGYREYLERVSAAPMPGWLHAQAMLNLAWTHDLAGRRADATRLYKRIVDDFEREAASGPALKGRRT